VKVAFITVVENSRLYGNTYLTWFSGDELLQGAGPGQFLMLRCVDSVFDEAGVPQGALLGSDPLLPRPMSYHRMRKAISGIEFSILYDVVGRGTDWLAQRQPGDQVFAWGPLGRGFSLRSLGQNVLLVGEGTAISPLLWLADEMVAKGKSVVLLAGGDTAEALFPAELVPPEVEVAAATRDGSSGPSGSVTDIIGDYYAWADQVFVSTPEPTLAALAERIARAEGPSRSRRRKSMQVLLRAPMACGTGICAGCAVFDRQGKPRLVCREGPRFDLRELW
jgi:dihydroorotate dehydrogenase electron transfer subunit